MAISKGLPAAAKMFRCKCELQVAWAISKAHLHAAPTAPCRRSQVPIPVSITLPVFRWAYTVRRY
jgi:hypothetical protein